MLCRWGVILESVAGLGVRSQKHDNKMKTHRLLFILAIIWGLAILPDTLAQSNFLARIDRTLAKEPRYETTPKYSLLVLGGSGSVKVWMVEDGRRLFVDKNANGDLTDDGPAIQPSNVRNMGAQSPGTERWDFNYLLDAITPAGGSRHTHFDLRRWNYGDKEDRYGLSLSVADQLPVYAGWFGTFWSTNSATAPVIHFGGPFTPKMLRAKEFVLGPGQQRISIAFVNPGSGAGAESLLSIDALPKYLTPKLNIEWPVAAGKLPLKTSHLLTERCCYWEFYTTTFETPDGAMVGMAKVSVELPESLAPIQLATTEFKAPVVAQAREPN